MADSVKSLEVEKLKILLEMPVGLFEEEVRGTASNSVICYDVQVISPSLEMEIRRAFGREIPEVADDYFVHHPNAHTKDLE